MNSSFLSRGRVCGLGMRYAGNTFFRNHISGVRYFSPPNTSRTSSPMSSSSPATSSRSLSSSAPNTPLPSVDFSHLANLREDHLRMLAERSEELGKALRILNIEAKNVNADTEIPYPNKEQYHRYFIANALPFFGFGFLDNSIMLLCGDFFDAHLGVSFGISTLAAAAMGNIVGDVSGIWLGGTVEAVASRLMPSHGLTAQQMSLHRSQTVKSLGMVCGIFFGCIMGMFPLMWPREYRAWGDRSTLERKFSSSDIVISDDLLL